MLSLKQAAQAVRFAEEGLAKARQQNDRDSEQAFQELLTLPASKWDRVQMHICLFDIDGTLISTGGAGRAALEAALASEFGIVYRIEPMLLSGRTDLAIVRTCSSSWHRGSPDPARKVNRGLPWAFTHPPGPTLGPALTRDFWPAAKSESAFRCHPRFAHRQHAARRLIKLGHFGIADYFCCGGYGDLCLDRDDVARAAVAAVHEHHPGDRSNDRLWVIGDTPLDIRCARRFGLRRGGRHRFAQSGRTGRTSTGPAL